MTLWRPVPKAVAALAAAGFLWLATAPIVTFAAAPPSGLDSPDPARAARDVFHDQDFWWKRLEHRRVSSSWLESIFTAVRDFAGRILRGILDLLARILRSLFSLFSGTSSGGSVAVWLIVAALLAWSIWKLYPVILRWLSGGAAAPGTHEGVTSQTLAEASDLFEQAGRAFREGAYAEAIRLALLALIARFEKQGLLRYDTTRTNREYQRELRHAPELAACFGQVARIYERVWYGRVSAGRAEAEDALHLSRSVIQGEDRAPE